jgi:hypothetical protein
MYYRESDNGFYKTELALVYKGGFMAVNHVLHVSEMEIMTSSDNTYSYGFTIAYQNGEIKNVMKRSALEKDEKVIKYIESERQKWIKKMCLKKED